MLAMGRNDRDKKLLSNGLRNAFRKAISRVSNAKIAVHPRSRQCWALKRSTFLSIIMSLIFAIPAFPQANGPSALGAASASAALDPSLVQLERSLGAYLVAALVWGIGLSLGGPTGYAINPARDLGPRLAHAVLPIANKGASGWSYAIVPIVGPLIGGGLAGLLLHAVIK